MLVISIYCSFFRRSLIGVEFSGSTGLLRSVTLFDSKEDDGKSEITKVNVNLEFVKYGVTNKKVGSTYELDNITTIKLSIAGSFIMKIQGLG